MGSLRVPLWDKLLLWVQWNKLWFVFFNATVQLHLNFAFTYARRNKCVFDCMDVWLFVCKWCGTFRRRSVRLVYIKLNIYTEIANSHRYNNSISCEGDILLSLDTEHWMHFTMPCYRRISQQSAALPGHPVVVVLLAYFSCIYAKSFLSRFETCLHLINIFYISWAKNHWENVSVSSLNLYHCFCYLKTVPILWKIVPNFFRNCHK